MKTPSAQSRDQWSRSVSSARPLRSKPHRDPRRLRRLLFEQFEDRRVLATAEDDVYITFQNQPLVINPDGAWSNDTIRQWGCVEYNQEYWVGEEYHPAGTECIEDGWVGMSPDNATGDIATEPQGSLTDRVQGARAFIYTPPQNFIGTDSFTYWIDDEEDPAYATVTIIVRAPNVPPQTNNNSGYSTNEDTQLYVGGSGVLANDTDANGDVLTAELVDNATNGFVYLYADGSFTYTPYENEHGSDSFTYKAYDGAAYGNVATVSLTVQPANDPPIAVNDSFNFLQDTPIAINFLANDTDIDGGGTALSATNISDPPHGTITPYPDGTFAYTPDAGYTGSDSFTYQVSDGQVTSGAGTVSIQVKADGVEILADITPGMSYSGPGDKELMGGALYFGAGSSSGGRELWKTDGTTGGTVQVADIVPGSGHSNPSRLTNVNGTLYFTAVDGVHGRELWKSDGTEAGTMLVKDINEGPADSDSFIPAFHNVNGTLFFFANDGINGTELWKSNGTEAGTVLVKDITPGSAGTSWHISTAPGDVKGGFRVIGNTLYFAIINGTSAQFWKSDGTESGTVLVKDFGTNSGLEGLTNLNGTLIFSTNSPTGGKLWKSDGTTSGTTLLREFHSPYYTYNPFTEYDGGRAWSFALVNNKVYFSAANGTSSGLWVTDGYSANFVHSTGILSGSEYFGTSVAIGNTFYFKAADYQLWRSDGTTSGTYKVKDVEPDNTVVANGKLYFEGYDGIHGQEPWVSDGTSSGTKLLKELEPGNSIYSYAQEFINFNGSVVFTGFNTTYGSEPWILRPVNHPPAGTNKTVALVQDATFTFSIADFGFTDTNDSPPNTLAAVKITSLPAIGTLTNNGAAVSLGQLIPAADISTGKLRYAPPAGSYGSNLANFMFHVQDNGGPAGYGSELDPSPNTITINVNQLADIALTSFSTSGTDLKFEYTITGTPPPAYTIALFASPDGVARSKTISYSPSSIAPASSAKATRPTTWPNSAALASKR
jgi:ELWxxDGT repeat protein/VCBS repeat-containing protein